jgi:hypothetical protein
MLHTNTTAADRAALFVATFPSVLEDLEPADLAALRHAVALARLERPADLALVELAALVGADLARDVH